MALPVHLLTERAGLIVNFSIFMRVINASLDKVSILK